jgi:hypothetical protein
LFESGELHQAIVTGKGQTAKGPVIGTTPIDPNVRPITLLRSRVWELGVRTGLHRDVISIREKRLDRSPAVTIRIVAISPILQSVDES